MLQTFCVFIPPQYFLMGTFYRTEVTVALLDIADLMHISFSCAKVAEEAVVQGQARLLHKFQDFLPLRLPKIL